MELRTYLRILLQRWQIVILAFMVTLVFTILFTAGQAPIYSASATYIVSPSNSSLDARGFLSGLDVLSGKNLIANTYAEIATSNAVKDAAARALGFDPVQSESFVVGSKLHAGTNVIEITVEGRDPVLVATYANQVGNSTVAFVAKLYEVYDLKALDAATPPTDPSKPNTKLNLILGGILGLTLGVGLAYAYEYLHIPGNAALEYGKRGHVENS